MGAPLRKSPILQIVPKLLVLCLEGSGALNWGGMTK
jgi:hypothetical protein